jgi:hypothetical protein
MALLGKVVRGTGSHNGYDMKELLPTSSKDYDRSWYQKHIFDDSDIENWSRLTSSQQYLCSDDPAIMKGIFIQPLPSHLDLNVILPGYRHDLMGVSHTDPQLQTEHRRPSVTGYPQIMIPPSQSPSMISQMTSPQQPVMMQQQQLISPHQQQMASPQQQQTVMYQQPMVPIYQQQQAQPQPLSYQQPMVSGYQQQPYVVPQQQPQPYAPYPQQMTPQQPVGYQMMAHPSQQQLLHHGSSAQFAPSQYSQPSPQQYPQQYPPRQQSISQPHPSQGYYPTQQPVQYHPGGYPKDPQYMPSATQQTQSLPIAYPVPQQEQQMQFPQHHHQQHHQQQPPPQPQGLQFLIHGAYHDDDPW